MCACQPIREQLLAYWSHGPVSLSDGKYEVSLGQEFKIAQLSLDSVPFQIEAESALYWGVRSSVRPSVRVLCFL